MSAKRSFLSAVLVLTILLISAQCRPLGAFDVGKAVGDAANAAGDAAKAVGDAVSDAASNVADQLQKLKDNFKDHFPNIDLSRYNLDFDKLHIDVDIDFDDAFDKLNKGAGWLMDNIDKGPLWIALRIIAVSNMYVTPDEPSIDSIRTPKIDRLPGHLRYSEACYLCSHNSFSNTVDGWYPYRQQHYGIRGQLARGVRAFMLDTWRKPDSSPDNPYSIVLSHENPRIQVFLRAMATLEGKGLPTFVYYLRLFRKFLANNPTEVITIILEEHYGENCGRVFDRAVETAGVQDLVLTEEDLWDRAEKASEMDDSGRPLWPTLKWMRDNDKRLVIFTSHSKNDAPDAFGKYCLDQWYYCVENQYGRIDKEGAAAERAESRYPYSGDGEKRYLYVYNFFPTFPLDAEAILNGLTSGNIIERAQKLARVFRRGGGPDFNKVNGGKLEEALDYAWRRGLGEGRWYNHRLPNFIAVDSIHEGNPMRLVREFNRRSMADSHRGDRLHPFGPLYWGRTDGSLPLEPDKAQELGIYDSEGRVPRPVLTHVAGDKELPPVIFVHGLNDVPSAYRNMLKALADPFSYELTGAGRNLPDFYDRYDVFTFGYNSYKLSVEQNALALRSEIIKAADNGLIPKGYLKEGITFVAHSTGGLVVRAYVAGGSSWPGGGLKRLVTLGTPHWGTEIAALGDIAQKHSEFWRDYIGIDIGFLRKTGASGPDLIPFSATCLKLFSNERDRRYRREGRYTLFAGRFDPATCDKIDLGWRLLAAFMGGSRPPKNFRGLPAPLKRVWSFYREAFMALGDNDSVVPTNSALFTFDDLPDRWRHILDGRPGLVRLVSGCNCNGEKYVVEWDHNSLKEPYKAIEVYSYILNGFHAVGRRQPRRVFRNRHMKAWTNE